MGVASAMTFSKLMAIVNANKAMNLTGGKLYEWIINIKGPLFTTVTMIMMLLIVEHCFFSKIWEPYIKLVLMICLGASFYIIIGWSVFNKDMMELKLFLKEVVSRHRV